MVFKNTWFSKTRDFQKHVVFDKPYKTKEKVWDNTLSLIMKLYFLDDGSLIIIKLRLDKVRSTTLIPPNQFEVVRTIGCHYLSHLSGKEAYDFLVEQSLSLDKDDLSSSTKCKEPLGAGIKKVK